jgi:hypothetical protein
MCVFWRERGIGRWASPSCARFRRADVNTIELLAACVGQQEKGGEEEIQTQASMLLQVLRF